MTTTTAPTPIPKRTIAPEEAGPQAGPSEALPIESSDVARTVTAQGPRERGGEARHERDSEFRTAELHRAVADCFGAVAEHLHLAVRHLRRDASLCVNELYGEYHCGQHHATSQTEERGFQEPHAPILRNAGVFGHDVYPGGSFRSGRGSSRNPTGLKRSSALVQKSVERTVSERQPAFHGRIEEGMGSRRSSLSDPRS
jgi:hypothetical protein